MIIEYTSDNDTYRCTTTCPYDIVDENGKTKLVGSVACSRCEYYGKYIQDMYAIECNKERFPNIDTSSLTILPELR